MGKSRENSPSNRQERFSPVQDFNQNRGNSPVNNNNFNNGFDNGFNQNRGNSPVNNNNFNNGFDNNSNQNRGNSPVNNNNFNNGFDNGYNQNRGNSPVNNNNFNNGFDNNSNQNRGNSPVNNNNFNNGFDNGYNQNRGNSPVNNNNFNNFNNGFDNNNKENRGDSPKINDNIGYGNQNRADSPLNNRLNGEQNRGDSGLNNNLNQVPPTTYIKPNIAIEQPNNNSSFINRDPQIPYLPTNNQIPQQPNNFNNGNHPRQPVPVNQIRPSNQSRPNHPSHAQHPVHPVHPVHQNNPNRPTHNNHSSNPNLSINTQVYRPTNVNVHINNPGPYISPPSRPPIQNVMNLPPVPANITAMYPDDDDVNSSRYRQPTIAPSPIPGLPFHYGSLSWGQKKPIPPPQIQFNNAPDSTPNYSSGITSVDEDTARNLFKQFALSNCCFGKNPANEANITKITINSALHYTLETFTQRRSIHYTFVPYRNEPLDSYQMGSIPDPWSINCSSNGDFVSCVRSIKVPHTEQVMSCYRCNGQGSLRCSGCSGSGRRRCTTCSGTGRTMRHVDGHPNYVTCYSCRGTGQDNCLRCNGRGLIKCSLCTGTCSINHKNDYVNEHTDLPDNLIKTVSGEPLLYQTAPILVPISNFDNKELVANSINLFNQHRNHFSMEYPLMQRQRLIFVPVIECHYSWKEFQGRFWIYGREMQVYCDDYPQSCCGCCCCCGGCCECCKCCNCSIQ